MALLAASLFTSCKAACPINSCQTRMVHRHGEQEFRGMPWYKKQNPRIGEKLDKPSKEVQKEMTKKKSKKKRKD
ncbi:hypothetical protein GCM10023183_05880 [Nibribacter koreensis]|uniref:Secreted protein n=1 Tax=Nibribacter koreensis TaxID=1084519 RepID=A0ABP8F8T0_9BACT